jgi:ABC-type transport system substrate-binding protein
MSASKSKRPLLAAIVIIIIVVAAVGVYFATQTAPSAVVSSSTSVSALQPSNSSQLVDNSLTSIEGAEDSLDPAVGFTLGDGGFYAATYQQLVEFNGSAFTQVVPVIASNYTIENNYQTFVFAVRPGVTFSNGDPVNAYTCWFSLARISIMGQGPGVSNYVELLFPGNYTLSGYALPWGVGDAINAATGMHPNPALAANALANMLSNFNPSNTTQTEIMSYPHQALVVIDQNTFEINLITSYRYFLLDLGAWWGAIQDPVFVDAHGGVQPNAANSYLGLNPEPVTGPYVVKSVSPGTQVVLQINKNYWGNSVSNLPAVAQPAHIASVIINYAPQPTVAMQSFISNQAQMSYVDPGSLSQVYSSYPAGYPPSSYLINTGPTYGVMYLALNTQRFPTSITDLRLALVHAINYTSIVHDVCKNLCTSYVGPISPYFTQFYNPGNLPVYSYNITRARQLINQAGLEGHFYVVIPNGTVLGDSSGTPLGTLTITIPAPITPFLKAQFSVIQSDWSDIGVAAAVQAVQIGVYMTECSTAQGTPLIQNGAWYPDWPDPIFQQMMANTGPEWGCAGNYAWYNNTQLLQLYDKLPFITNQTEQLQLVKGAYQTIYNDAPYVWLPDPDTYFLVQPYVKGFVFNPLYSYYYNMMYYSSS